MRRHANFAEWVPLVLILIALLELNGVRPVSIHALGAALVVARLAHAVGIRGDTMKNPWRFIGATTTALVTVISSVWLIIVFATRIMRSTNWFPVRSVPFALRPESAPGD